MRFAIVILIGIMLVASYVSAATPAFRELPDIDVSVFTCTPSPSHFLIASRADLQKVFARLAPHCGAAEFDQRKAAFLQSLDTAHFEWNEEVVVIASDWYGTGMAKPRIVFSGPSERVLTATINWMVPPPPVTPDTASCRFAFAVRRAAVDRIVVVGQNSGTVTFKIAQ